MTMTHDLYAIGNALVDTEFQVSDSQLQLMGVDKGHMTLIDEPRRAELLSYLGDAVSHRTGGGSAANTAVALAQLGGRAFYSCRVADDELGRFYRDDLLSHGVQTNLRDDLQAQGQTGSCMVLITPDAERSMNTFLGVSSELEAGALREAEIRRSRIYYMEGYLAASPSGLAAALQGRQIAREAGCALALTLSDVSMIRFCRAGLEAMLGDGLDYLFCNEEEARVWCDSQDMDHIGAQLAGLARTVCMTRGARGCLILENGQRSEFETEPVMAVDTNGAGDMFAGAFLYATTQGHSRAHAAWLGNRAAGRIVAQYGNRLAQPSMQALQAAYTAHQQA